MANEVQYMTVPDIVLLETVNAAIQALRDDYITTTVTNSQPESKTMLYYMLGTSAALQRYNFFEQAKKIILTTPQQDGDTHLEANLSFDMNSWKGNPIIYITMPSSQGIHNSLGLGEGNFDEILDGNGNFKKQFVRRKRSTYQIMILSNNKTTTMLLYYLIDCLILACHDHLELSGLSNIQYNGGDLNIREVLPDKVFGKYIGLTFEYETVGKEFNINAIVSNIEVIIQMKNDLDDSFEV